MSIKFRLFIKLSIIYCFFSLLLSIVNSYSASAFQGTGYFNNALTVCSTDVNLSVTCTGKTGTDISASQNDVIFKPTIPTDKSGFIIWLTGEHDKSTNASKFIIATMIGDKTQGGNLQGAIDRINNPNLTLEVITGNPLAYGGTSLYGADKNKQRDYFFASDYDPGSRDLLVFKTDNIIRYVLELGCANPVGKLNKLPPPPSWSLEAYASVYITTPAGVKSGPFPNDITPNATAEVGDTITWGHRVENKGPDTTNKEITYSWQNTDGFPSGSGDFPVILASPGIDPDKQYPDGGDPSWSDTPYVVKDTDQDKVFCRRTAASPWSDSSTDKIYSNEACVTIESTGSDGGPSDGGTPDGGPSDGGTCRPIKVVTLGNPRRIETSSGDHNNGTTPRINVTLYNTDTRVRIDKGFHDAGTTLELTTDCTTGDVWQVQERVSSYIYYDYDYWVSCGTAEAPSSCPRHSDRYTTYSRNTLVGPCFNYKLTTEIDGLSMYSAEVGNTVDIRPVIDSEQAHTGYPQTKTKNSDWRITKIVIDPDKATPTNIGSEENDLGPCDYVTAQDSSPKIHCIGDFKTGRSVFSGGSVASWLRGDTTSSNYTIEDLLPGTKVCFMFSINPSQSDPVPLNETKLTAGGKWVHSRVIAGKGANHSCIVVVKKPKVQIWGGDLSAGKAFGSLTASRVDVKTSISKKGNNTFGSWIEYGIFASGTITSAASGSAFAGVGGLNVTNVCNYSTLSFANTTARGSSCTSSTVIGNYKALTSIPDVEASFQGGTSNFIHGSVSPSDLDGGVYTAVDITLNSNAPLSGKSVIIKSTGTVKITNDQKYSSGRYTAISDLPQLVIIADNIVIDSAVKQVDAWLIASGFINTCSAVNNKPRDGEEMSITVCANQLTINGPVMANKLYLNRTYGSGKEYTSGDPAEIFNLRADAYLWAYNRASGNGHMQTVYSTELPVRL